MPICVKEYQGKRKNQAKMQGNEHIRELISKDFIFFKRGMLGNIRACQEVPECAREF